VRQRRDEVISRYVPALLPGVCGELLHQFRPVSHHADPAGDRVQEPQIILAEELRVS
jgi:hypothetical protein